MRLCGQLTRRRRCPHSQHLQGIKNVPKKLRIVIQRKRNEDDEDSVSGGARWRCLQLDAAAPAVLAAAGVAATRPLHLLLACRHTDPALASMLSSLPQEEMFSLVTLAEDQTTKKGVVVLEA